MFNRKFNSVRRAGVALVLAAAMRFSLAAPAVETTYVVRRSDSLSAIARKYGVSARDIAERNGLARNAYVYIGQRLVIPNRASSEPSATPTGNLPSSVREAIAKAPVQAERWRYIVVHHSGVDEGTVKGMDDYHRRVRHMENGLAYHFVIGNGHGMRDGEVTSSERWREQLDGGHLRSEEQNKIALGICLVGNFDDHKPTEKQMQSLNALVRALMKRCNVPASRVKTHQQINIVGTECPGSKFPTKSFLGGLRSGD